MMNAELKSYLMSLLQHPYMFLKLNLKCRVLVKVKNSECSTGTIIECAEKPRAAGSGVRRLQALMWLLLPTYRFMQKKKKNADRELTKQMT